MKRYTITLGALTSVGGKVIGASASGCVNGAAIALEGDAIFCPACKSTGRIVCVEPRIPELWNGKKVALENDLCVCACLTPPRLVPNQTLRCQILSEIDGGRQGSSDWAETSNKNASEAGFDDKFRLVDAETGEAIRLTEYCVKRANGRLEFGLTDGDGLTHLLSAEASAESVEIYV